MRGEFVRQLNFTGSNAAVRTGPPAGKRWRLLSGTLTFTADATVSTRKVNIDVLDAAAGVQVWNAVAMDITASQVVKIQLGGGPPSSACLNSLHQFAPVPLDPICFPGDLFGVGIVSGGVAGDVFTFKCRVAESFAVAPPVSAYP
jgi:hypothetical protein